jgi:hypothetical protein
LNVKDIQMKRFALLLVLPALTVACGAKSSQPSLLSGPTPIGAAITVDDAYSFDPTQLGRVTLTNTHATAMDYTFVVWRYYAEDDNQVNKGQASYHLAPGETRVLTVGVQEECGAKYLRNVFVGIAALPDANPFTMSDLRNYQMYAPGSMWNELSCDAPVVVPVPPPVVCASALGVPAPCRR